MTDTTIKAIIFLQNWGDKKMLVKELNQNKHVISIFHIMGRYSYLLDVNFDNKKQLEQWINKFKSIELSSGIPAVKDMQTQKIINIYKKRENYSIEDYQQIKDKYHFFMIINAPHHDDELIDAMKNDDIIHSILHIQGNNSLIAELVTESPDSYKGILDKMKDIQSIYQIDILEVLHVDKYRNEVIDEGGNLVYPDKDIREIYTL